MTVHVEVRRIGEASKPGPPRVIIKPDAYWIGDNNPELQSGPDSDSDHETQPTDGTSPPDTHAERTTVFFDFDDPDADCISEGDSQPTFEGATTVNAPRAGDAYQHDNTNNTTRPTFIPSTKFRGAKTGYHFKLGSKGLGYYSDVTPRCLHLDAAIPHLSQSTVRHDSVDCDTNTATNHMEQVHQQRTLCGQFVQAVELYRQCSHLYAAALWQLGHMKLCAQLSHAMYGRTLERTDLPIEPTEQQAIRQHRKVGPRLANRRKGPPQLLVHNEGLH